MYVQPHLDYCDTIYDCHLTVADKARLEKAQNRAARLITATPRRTHTAGLRAELGWTPLETRRSNHRLQLYHKIIFDQSTPEFIKDIIPNSRQSDTERVLRSTQCNQLTIPKAQTASYARAFIPTTTKLWNQLPNALRCETNFKIFKREIHEPTKTSSNPYLSIGPKLSNMLHTQIRLNCSGLNDHRYRSGRTDSPKCRCGADREDTEHFLLRCPMFIVERTELSGSISAILNMDFQNLAHKAKIKILLYGTCKIRVNDAAIANVVQRFIQRTQRFARNQPSGNSA